MNNQPKLFESGVKVRTGEVRLSYAHLFEPHAAKQDQREAYSASLLIPKTDTSTIKIIRLAIENAKKRGVEDKRLETLGLSVSKVPQPSARRR